MGATSERRMDYEEPKSHRLTSGLSICSVPGSALVKICFGIINSMTGAFLTSLDISASISCGFMLAMCCIIRSIVVHLHCHKSGPGNPPGCKTVL